MRQPIKIHGGKHYLAKKILALFPPRESYIHYVEPFFGGGAVLFAHNPEGKSEVVNDINGRLINFWTVLRDHYDDFARLCEATPFSEQHWKGAVAWRERNAGLGVQDAYLFFVQYRQSRQGLGKCFATMSRNRTRRSMNEQAASWLSAIEGLAEAHARLQRVVILARDAYDVIQQQDGRNTVFYCDPPYVSSTRSLSSAYDHEMSDTDHSMLLDVLGNIQGRFLLSGYHNDMYDTRAKLFGWRRVDFLIDNKASGSKTKELKTESVWMNY